MPLFQNERPSIQDLPKDLVPFLESCWAEDPKCRPEFMEITGFLHNFCSVLTKPPKVFEIEDPMSTKTASTGHSMNKYEDKGRKRKGWSPRLLSCFVGCVPE